jgi:hypothetical protein
VSAELARAGEAVVSAAGELARAWRAARAEAWPGTWPGLADGVVEPLVVEAGLALARGEEPTLAWDRVTGHLRLDPRDRDASRARAAEELRLLAELLERACATLPEGETAGRALARGVREGADRIGAGAGLPPGVLTIWACAAR